MSQVRDGRLFILKKYFLLSFIVLMALFGQSMLLHGYAKEADPLDFDPNRPEYYTPEFKAVAEQLHSQDSCSSLYACPSGPLARTAKDKIVELLNEGKTTDEILDYFVENYGESILLKPHGSLNTLSAYVIPFFLIAVVAVVIFAAVRSWVKKSGSTQEKEKNVKLSENEAESDVIRQMIEDERKKFL